MFDLVHCIMYCTGLDVYVSVGSFDKIHVWNLIISYNAEVPLPASLVPQYHTGMSPPPSDSPDTASNWTTHEGIAYPIVNTRCTYMYIALWHLEVFTLHCIAKCKIKWVITVCVQMSTAKCYKHILYRGFQYLCK